ncbi:MAG: alpha/beta hydrolase [Dehalococcoidia bacterium]|nr:alpha/beta hydrolase [Dehalococcoidia bacterium]
MRRRTAVREVARRPLPPGTAAADHVVTGPDGHGVAVRLYRPARLAAAAPTLFWIHGGGMIGGSIELAEFFCAGLAADLGILVAAVEYRVAPEHPYPLPLEDCYTGLRWLHASAAELGVDRDRIAIGGSSAGGGLAAGLALLARDRGEVRVCYQHLIYPMLDDRNETPSSHAIRDPRAWNRTANLAGWDAYLGGRAGAPDVSPYAAPARARALEGLPPAYICVGTLDLFLDEDIAYARALLLAGVPTELHLYPGVYHGAPTFVPKAAISRRWHSDQRDALARGLGVR